jgi:hypothetical protein
VIWFFDRNGQRLRYQIRRSEESDGYELAVTYPDGRVEVEEMREPSDLLKRCAELAEDLREEGWQVGGH